MDVVSVAENATQGFGLNFERSVCSKAYYDYYRYLDLLAKESRKTKDEGKDLSKISMYQKNISNIESSIIPDCKMENGNEIEILLNEEEMKPARETGNSSTVVAKETVKVKNNNELYGGFNEICVSDYDINNMIDVYNEQNGTNVSLPNVVVYKDKFMFCVERMRKMLMPPVFKKSM